MADYRRRKLAAALVLTLGLIGAGIWLAFQNRESDSVPAAPGAKGPETTHPIRPLTKSPFQNTRDDAHYVGSATCRDCHADEYRSYMRTGMGQAMREANLAQRRPNAVVDHKPSSRRYEVYRKQEQLRHREFLTAGEGGNLVLADHAMKYVVGSGALFQIFLTEVDGFLVESPVTWYVGKPGWDMSPGYDRPFHRGFGRPVMQACLFCHAGRVEPIEKSYHRFRIHELGIGCERCHGPGSLHVEKWSGDGAQREGKIDDSIVNPVHLNRSLADDVCHQCHLTTKSYVEARGRRIQDFRPGLPLREFRHYYKLVGRKSPMQVVGHSQQQLLSSCYTKSKTLTCITCHNPHKTPEPAMRVDHYRKICLQCHAQESCRVDPAERQRRSAINDCTHCHMPRVETKTLHTAVTHHRIGIHPEKAEPPEDVDVGLGDVGRLAPLHDLSHLRPIDAKRSLGLAYLDLTLHSNGGPNLAVYRDRSRQLLAEVRRDGLQDGAVNGILAQLYWEADPSTAIRCAQDALKDPHLPIRQRMNALFALASHDFDRNKLKEAEATLRQLIRLRRHPADHELLGNCALLRNDVAGAIAHYRTAVEIRPDLAPIHRNLARLYRQSGDPAREKRHQEIARRFEAIMENRRRNDGTPRR
jgi:predicted CXXCH cytochrome family protein